MFYHFITLNWLQVNVGAVLLDLTGAHCATSTCLARCVDVCVDLWKWQLQHVTDWGELGLNFGQQRYLVEPASVRRDNYSWQTGCSKVADGRYCIPVHVSALWNLLAKWKMCPVLALRLAFLGPQLGTRWRVSVPTLTSSESCAVTSRSTGREANSVGQPPLIFPFFSPPQMFLRAPFQQDV